MSAPTTTPMTNTEIREALAAELNRHIGRYWLLPPDSWNPDDDSSSFIVADAVLAALTDAGLDLQELQAKAATLDNVLELVSGGGECFADAQRYALFCLQKHRARLIPEQGEKS